MGTSFEADGTSFPVGGGDGGLLRATMNRRAGGDGYSAACFLLHDTGRGMFPFSLRGWLPCLEGPYARARGLFQFKGMGSGRGVETLRGGWRPVAEWELAGGGRGGRARPGEW